MAEKKCPYCGSTSFVQIPLVVVSGLDVGSTENVTTTACVECGHVEIIAKPEVIQKTLDSIKQREEKDAKIAEIKKEIDATKKEIDRLKKVVVDENQTVKAVREAKDQITHLGNQLRTLESKLGNLTNHWNSW